MCIERSRPVASNWLSPKAVLKQPINCPFKPAQNSVRYIHLHSMEYGKILYLRTGDPPVLALGRYLRYPFTSERLHYIALHYRTKQVASLTLFLSHSPVPPSRNLRDFFSSFQIFPIFRSPRLGENATSANCYTTNRSLLTNDRSRAVAISCRINCRS